MDPRLTGGLGVMIRGFYASAPVPVMFSPFLIFLLLFVAAPLVELFVLIEVGSEIGALSTILLSVFTALLGGFLVRYQGLSVLFRAQSQLARDSVPALELLEGATLLMVGFALMLPGFITDTVGFLLLIPPLRRALVMWFVRRRGIMRPGGPPPRSPADGGDESPRVIEGEYRRED